jgi:phytoene dehydrogenase-like protein
MCGILILTCSSSRCQLGDFGMTNLLHFAPYRSDYRTPVKGLYLCGSGAHPGGGVMGAPGRNAASIILEDLKVK